MAAARLAEVCCHCEAARRGEERGGNSRFWRQCWERMAVAVLPGSGKALQWSLPGIAKGKGWKLQKCGHFTWYQLGWHGTPLRHTFTCKAVAVSSHLWLELLAACDTLRGPGTG